MKFVILKFILIEILCDKVLKLNLNKYIINSTNNHTYITKIKSVPVVIVIKTNEILNYTYVLEKKQKIDFKLIKCDCADLNLK